MLALTPQRPENWFEGNYDFCFFWGAGAGGGRVIGKPKGSNTTHVSNCLGIARFAELVLHFPGRCVFFAASVCGPGTHEAPRGTPMQQVVVVFFPDWKRTLD